MWQSWKFPSASKAGTYYICTICHQSQHSVKLFKHEKYHILTAELYHPVKSFDEKLYICETCHKHLCKKEIPCQEVCNKMMLDAIPDELKELKKTRKSIYFQDNFV